MADVIDEKDRHRFAVHLDGREAELVYRLEGDRLILVHTGVPDELGGQGIGGQLVRAAVDRAEQEGLTIAPWCPFARKWLEDHPDEAARVTLDLRPRPSSA
jgi:predicted GNAT family acetyltransferase